MHTYRPAIALGTLALLAFSAGCTPDLPTAPLEETPSATLEIVSVDAFGAVMRVTEPDREPVLLTLGERELEGELSPTEFSTDITIGGSEPNQAAWLLPAAIAALRVWSVVETIRVCAPPVYQAIRRNGNVTQGTIDACATEAATNVAGGILAKVLKPTIKVTALRSSIKSMVGNVVTHRQLQRVINKQTKASLTELVRQMTSVFYSELLKGYTKIFNDYKIK